MSTYRRSHQHYCISCWKLYDCHCTATVFAPESYRCITCSTIQNDTDFMYAVGIKWADPAGTDPVTINVRTTSQH